MLYTRRYLRRYRLERCVITQYGCMPMHSSRFDGKYHSLGHSGGHYYLGTAERDLQTDQRARSTTMTLTWYS